MAKIFRTEELSVNGDSIRISAENGNLIFKDANSNVVTSTDIRTQEVSSLAFKDLDLDSDVSSLKDEIADAVSDANVNIDNDISSLQAQRKSDEDTNDEEISSLHAQRTGDEAVKTQEVSSLAFKDLDLDSDISSLKAAVSDVDSNLDEDISSLQAQRKSDEDTNDEEISSLHAQRTGDEAVKTQEVSSLAFKDLDLDSNVSSLAALAAKNDVVVAEKQIWSTGDAVSSVTIDLGREFSTTPKVVGVLMTSVDTDPIIGFMLKSVNGGSGSNHTATFVFSDDIASTSYKMQVLASI